MLLLLDRNVSASVRQLDFSALAESDLPFPLRRDEDIGQGQGEETWKCLKPDGESHKFSAVSWENTAIARIPSLAYYQQSHSRFRSNA